MVSDLHKLVTLTPGINKWPVGHETHAIGNRRRDTHVTRVLRPIGLITIPNNDGTGEIVMTPPPELLGPGLLILLPSLFIGELARIIGMAWDEIIFDVQAVTIPAPNMTLSVLRQWTTTRFPDNSRYTIDTILNHTKIPRYPSYTPILPLSLRIHTGSAHSCTLAIPPFDALQIKSNIPGEHSTSTLHYIMTEQATTFIGVGKLIHILPIYLGKIISAISVGELETTYLVESITSGQPMIRLTTHTSWTELGPYAPQHSAQRESTQIHRKRRPKFWEGPSMPEEMVLRWG